MSSVVRIADFGPAKLATEQSISTSGSIAGTPSFMSPEQASSEVVDHRSDLFSLGVLLYLMASGEFPFKGDNPFATLDQIRRVEPDPLQSLNAELDPNLCSIVDKLLKKRIDDRFQNAREVIEALAAIKSGSNERSKPSAQRSATMRAWVVAGMALGALLIAGLSYFLWQTPREARSAPTDPSLNKRPFEIIINGDRTKPFDSLLAAIISAPSNAVLEIFGDDEVPSEAGIQISKPLTITAAPGFSPRIVPINKEEATPAVAWLVTKNPISLEGLTIEWPMAFDEFLSSQAVMSRFGIIFEGGESSLRQCCFKSGKNAGCVAASKGSSLNIDHCQFLSPKGYGVGFTMHGCRVSIENSYFEGYSALVTAQNLSVDESKSTISIQHSTINNDRLAEVYFSPLSRAPIQFNLSYSVFPVQHLFVLLPSRTNQKQLKFFQEGRVPENTKEFIEFKEDHNVFSKKSHFLSVQRVSGGITIPTKISNLKEWDSLFDLRDTGSVVASFSRPKPNPESDGFVDRLKVENADGMIPEGVGAPGTLDLPH